jgi:hypothetical protein
VSTSNASVRNADLTSVYSKGLRTNAGDANSGCTWTSGNGDGNGSGNNNGNGGDKRVVTASDCERAATLGRGDNAEAMTTR